VSFARCIDIAIAGSTRQIVAAANFPTIDDCQRITSR
jgi:hypothetical protein